MSHLLWGVVEEATVQKQIRPLTKLQVFFSPYSLLPSGPLQHPFPATPTLCALQPFGKMGVHTGRPLTLAENRALLSQLGVWGMQEAAHNLINNSRASGDCEGFKFVISAHTLLWQKRQEFHVCILRQTHSIHDNTLMFQRMACLWVHSTHSCKCTHVRVPPPLTRIFHFITSLVCDDRDKTAVTEMSEGGKEKGGLKLNGKLCTSIKTRGGDIKSYTPVPGDRMQEGGKQWKATVQSESLGFSHRGRRKRREARQDGYV